MPQLREAPPTPRALPPARGLRARPCLKTLIAPFFAIFSLAVRSAGREGGPAHLRARVGQDDTAPHTPRSAGPPQPAPASPHLTSARSAPARPSRLSPRPEPRTPRCPALPHTHRRGRTPPLPSPVPQADTATEVTPPPPPPLPALRRAAAGAGAEAAQARRSGAAGAGWVREAGGGSPAGCGR